MTNEEIISACRPCKYCGEKCFAEEEVSGCTFFWFYGISYFRPNAPPDDWTEQEYYDNKEIAALCALKNQIPDGMTIEIGMTCEAAAKVFPPYGKPGFKWENFWTKRASPEEAVAEWNERFGH